jgi:hypothetical protein
VFDFVNPFRPVRNLRGLGRNAGFKGGFWHMGKIGKRQAECDLRVRFYCCPGYARLPVAGDLL